MNCNVHLVLYSFFWVIWPAEAQYHHPVPQNAAATSLPPNVPLGASAPNQAVNPNNPLKNAATDRLDSIMKNLSEAMKVNPFFQLAGISMQIRQLAITNPDALKQAGVYVVPAPKMQSETEKLSDTLASQGLQDIMLGKDSSAVKMQAKEEQAAKNEYDETMDPANQASLEKALPPQERLRYDQQRIAQIKNQISVHKKKIEKARKAIRKAAENREQ